MKRVGQGGLYPVMQRVEVEAWIEMHCRPIKHGERYRFRWREDLATRPVLLEVVLDEHLDVPVVVLYVALFASAGFDLASALTNNRFLSVGSIALDGPHLVLRHVLPLESLTPSELERSLHVLALEASTLRRACIRPPIPQASFLLFAHLTY